MLLAFILLFIRMFSRPKHGSRLTGPVGNNAFAYEQRKTTHAEPKLRLPAVKQINSRDEITLGTLPTFTELDDNDNVISYTGLEYIYHISPPPLGKGDGGGFIPPIYIFDNHNYALYFRTQQWADDIRPYKVIHIDQHSDLGTPPELLSVSSDGGSYPPLYDIAHYTTHICNVGNFIRPALDAGIISECVRIKNAYDLEQFCGSYPPLQQTKNAYDQQKNGESYSPLEKGKQVGYILDIDLDFWAPGMGTDLDITIPLVQSLMHDASLITIASSPYFLDQPYALQLLKGLFSR